MRHKKLSLLMASMMHHVNNTPKCSMCDNNIISGIVRDSFYYCNDTCYQNKMFFSTPPRPQPQPQNQTQNQQRPKPQATSLIRSTSVVPRVDEDNCRHHGTCATCRNTYKYSNTCVDKGDTWFCGKTCYTVYESCQRAAQFPAPVVGFPFASNMQTMFPISVSAKTGKMVF